MTAANVTFDIRPRTAPDVARARPAGMLHDIFTIAGRALRAVPRDLEAIIPPVFIAFFFFIVNIGTLENLTQNNIQGFDYTAFEMADRRPARRHRRVARPVARGRRAERLLRPSAAHTGAAAARS